ncbi:uncharacterized protein SCDLUD_000572 [Saccharomycodes ludwigii]|uniref:uncharacterized protein n=1 Tax=Saccharomycodes ludwigii TaxID=36035 RepID=UPI001E895208|nr:hypothetical protein SCDLUD_000572 [Saccharomycodes ludwigii]KAH3902972.1 hypothetical protein SCDLUD_000572 [Saccharomycodes ludwigii]
MDTINKGKLWLSYQIHKQKVDLKLLFSSSSSTVAATETENPAPFISQVIHYFRNYRKHNNYFQNGITNDSIYCQVMIKPLDVVDENCPYISLFNEDTLLMDLYMYVKNPAGTESPIKKKDDFIKKTIEHNSTNNEVEVIRLKITDNESTVSTYDNSKEYIFINSCDNDYTLCLESINLGRHKNVDTIGSPFIKKFLPLCLNCVVIENSFFPNMKILDMFDTLIVALVQKENCCSRILVELVPPEDHLNEYLSSINFEIIIPKNITSTCSFFMKNICSKVIYQDLGIKIIESTENSQNCNFCVTAMELPDIFRVQDQRYLQFNSENRINECVIEMLINKL